MKAKQSRMDSLPGLNVAEQTCQPPNPTCHGMLQALKTSLTTKRQMDPKPRYQHTTLQNCIANKSNDSNVLVVSDPYGGTATETTTNGIQNGSTATCYRKAQDKHV